MDPVRISKQFALPFYPMRPRTGASISSSTDISLLDPRYFWTLKLNGDRVCLASLNGETLAINRHGSRYKFKIKNKEKYEALRGTWLFDGEVFGGEFFPFETLVSAGDESLSFKCPSARTEIAKRVCEEIGVEWVYGTDIEHDAHQAFLLDRLGAKIEGVVGKKYGSIYVPIGSASQTSQNWVKRKWAR